MGVFQLTIIGNEISNRSLGLTADNKSVQISVDHKQKNKIIFIMTSIQETVKAPNDIIEEMSKSS